MSVITTSGDGRVDDLEQLVERAGHADDLELGLGVDETDDALPEQVVVVGYHHPHHHGKQTTQAARRLLSRRVLEREQGALGLDASAVLTDGAVAAHDAVARHEQRHRVPRARRADGAHRVRRAGRPGDGGIALRRPERDLAQVGEHVAAEPTGEAEVERHVEPAPASGEVLLELTGGGIESRRVAEDARAHVGRQLGEHLVVILAGEGDPDHAGRGRRQQQGTEWAVERAVGDVEQAGAIGIHGERGAPLFHRLLVRDRHGGRQQLAHPPAPSRRSLAIPSAALRRAAASVVPSRAATSAYDRSAR